MQAPGPTGPSCEVAVAGEDVGVGDSNSVKEAVGTVEAGGIAWPQQVS